MLYQELLDPSNGKLKDPFVLKHIYRIPAHLT
jgi:hypothetical protein